MALIRSKRRSKGMSGWLIALTGLIYAGVAVEQGLKDNIPMCLTYLGYAFANVGLYKLAS